MRAAADLTPSYHTLAHRTCLHPVTGVESTSRPIVHILPPETAGDSPSSCSFAAPRPARSGKVAILTTGTIFDVKRFSIHDGPGIRTTVFFKGCPLSCLWCHNPEGQRPEPELIFRANRCLGCGACVAVCCQGAISMDGDVPVTDSEKCKLCGACVEACYAEAREIAGREVTVAQLVSEIGRDIPFFDQSGGGVTISGGEPLFQKEFLLALLRECRRQEIHTALDTCGHASWEALDSVREYVDVFLYDLKVMDDRKHRKFTGVSNDQALDNLEALSQEGHSIVLRVPIVPGISDGEENIGETGALAAGLASVERVDLLPYHHTAIHKYAQLDKHYELRETRPPSDEQMTELAEALRRFGLPVQIGG